MLNDEQYELWCRKNGYRGEARTLIDKIRSSEPVRLVRGSGSSVIGQFPSRKMRRTLQFESHRCELRFLIQTEKDDDAKEILDQPTTYNVTILTKSGRRVSIPYTPDFLVLRDGHAEFIECKTEDELIRLAKENPDRYSRDEKGVWHSPPAEEFPRKLGIRHKIVSTASINPIYVRNLEFLDDYIRSDSLEVSDEARKHVLALVKEHRGITLAKLLKTILEADHPVADADDVYMLIVRGEIYVNLHAEPLAERERALVFENEALAEAYGPSPLMPLAPRPEYLDIAEKKRVVWDKKVWEIVNVGEEYIWLVGEKGGDCKFTPERFEELLRNGTVEIVGPKEETDPYSLGLEILDAAKPHVRAEAERRLEIIKPYLDGEKKLRGTKRERSKARYITAYKEALVTYGVGLVGLLPRWPDQGNRRGKLLDAVIRIIEDRIKNDYETNVQKNITVVWGAALNDCRALEIPEEQWPSYSTFYNRVIRRPLAEQTKKRKGKRASYKHETFIYWLDKDSPPHGDRPFQIAHIDSTELDIELIDSETGENFGRPWASFMVDAYSRRLLAIVVTYDPPSYRSVMLLFRECVRRFGRLPQTLVMDRGNEHTNVYVRRFTGAFEIVVKWRPKAKPRHGSVGERLFGKDDKEFIHNLLGNTQIMTEVRIMTKELDPKEHAVWNIRDFGQWLRGWGYRFYDTRQHWTLKESPLALFARALKLTGTRRKPPIKFNETFRIMTMPYGPRMVAKVDADGSFKVNYVRYQHDDLRESQFVGKRLLVRYDPHNRAVAYIHTGKAWLRCRSEHYTTFEYCTEKQLEAVSKELLKKDQNLTRARSVSASELADFITSAERHQATLAAQRFLLQRRKDKETWPLLRLIDGLAPEVVAPDVPPQAHAPTAAETAPAAREVSPFAAVSQKNARMLKELA